MGAHEAKGKSDEWYTPPYIFEAMGVRFDMDVAAAPDGMGCVPADILCRDAFNTKWTGFVWCNPPWSGRGKKKLWIDLIIAHGNGILLTPDRSSAPWWQDVVRMSDMLMMMKGKIKFTPGLGNKSNGKSPGCGTTLFAFGDKAKAALLNGEDNGLGVVLYRSEIAAAERKVKYIPQRLF